MTAIGSAPHLAGVAVEQATSGAKWQYVPYKGGSQAIGDTVAGQTQVLMNGMLATLPFVQSGKLKVIGVSKATRVPLLPDVPTIAEQGVAGLRVGHLAGRAGPAACRTRSSQRLSAELTRIIARPTSGSAWSRKARKSTRCRLSSSRPSSSASASTGRWWSNRRREID